MTSPLYFHSLLCLVMCSCIRSLNSISSPKRTLMCSLPSVSLPRTVGRRLGMKSPRNPVLPVSLSWGGSRSIPRWANGITAGVTGACAMSFPTPHFIFPESEGGSKLLSRSRGDDLQCRVAVAAVVVAAASVRTAAVPFQSQMATRTPHRAAVSSSHPARPTVTPHPPGRRGTTPPWPGVTQNPGSRWYHIMVRRCLRLVQICHPQLKYTTINTSNNNSPAHVTINGPPRNKTTQTSSINNKEFTNNSRCDLARH